MRGVPKVLLARFEWGYLYSWAQKQPVSQDGKLGYADLLA